MLELFDKSILILGEGILTKIKYDFDYRYSLYDFFKIRFQKKELLKTRLSNKLYKTI